MTKARLIITAIHVEKLTQAEVARRYGVSQSWVSKLLKRYAEEGETAFEHKSRKPHTSPRALNTYTLQLILKLRETLTQQGHDAGPHTIAWHLDTHHNITVNPSTIWRYLKKHGAITPQPQKKPRSSYIRFQAQLPNETWQADFTHYRLSTGENTEIITWLDDHSRFALHISAHHRITGKIVLHSFIDATEKHGKPASTLTDNGMVFTARLAAGRNGLNSRNALENYLAQHGIRQKNSTPGHPTTCGKVERFQQTLKNWLAWQPQPHTLHDLQTLIDKFTTDYNHARPHRSLRRRTPAQAYNALPKDTPNPETMQRESRVRHDTIDDTGVITLRHAGKLHHIGVGRAHKNTKVIMLIDHTNIRIVDRKTGELLRDLKLDTTRDYQPQD